MPLIVRLIYIEHLKRGTAISCHTRDDMIAIHCNRVWVAQFKLEVRNG